jgi:RNA polymerase sigma-70 factor (ECF subfamily)
MVTSPGKVPEPADAARVSGTRFGPVEPFDKLYRQHFDFVWKCARAFGSTPQEVDDVVQDVFMVVQRRLDDLRDETLARSWVYGITRRVVHSHRRRRSKGESGEPVEVDALTSPGQSPLAAAEQSARLRLLSVLLDGLDEPKREVFVLSEILEMNGREIAETLGIPMNTVYSRLRVAREEFDKAAQRHVKALERGKVR